jgi:hypothetical protein
MPLLELLAWLLIAGGLLVLAGCIGLAFSIKNEVETAPVLLMEVTGAPYGADFQDEKTGARFVKRPASVNGGASVQRRSCVAPSRPRQGDRVFTGTKLASNLRLASVISSMERTPDPRIGQQ